MAEKTPGEVAYEEHHHGPNWEHLMPQYKPHWEKIAAAVIAHVKPRIEAEARACAVEDAAKVAIERLKEHLAAERKRAERYLDAIFKIADDGWLMHGAEGMDDTQLAVWEIAMEHEEYKRRAGAKNG